MQITDFWKTQGGILMEPLGTHSSRRLVLQWKYVLVYEAHCSLAGNKFGMEYKQAWM